MRKVKSKPKPEIVNFRINWPKVVDLCAVIGLGVFMAWVMWAVTTVILNTY